MTSIDQKIINRIKKCFAMADSSNPNEAATALRQAHALMDKHGISSLEITMADIGEGEAAFQSLARDKPARWEGFLATMIAKAFGCQILTSLVQNSKVLGVSNEGTWIFVGLKQKAELAAYTMIVLARRCKKARREWLASGMGGLNIKAGEKRAKKTMMADAFAEGWVCAVTKMVQDFAIPPEMVVAIGQHIESRVTGTGKSMTSRPVKSVGAAERYAAGCGIEAAKGESLHRPMDSGPKQAALPGAAK